MEARGAIKFLEAAKSILDEGAHQVFVNEQIEQTRELLHQCMRDHRELPITKEPNNKRAGRPLAGKGRRSHPKSDDNYIAPHRHEDVTTDQQQTRTPTEGEQEECITKATVAEMVVGIPKVRHAM